MGTRWYSITAAIMLLALFLFTNCGMAQPEREDPRLTDQLVEPHYYRAPAMPETITFMGDPVPLDRFDVRENLEREMIVNAYFHSQTLRLIKIAPRFFSIIDPILKEEGIPLDFRYLAVAESGLNPRALSPAGAAGIWQFMKPAATDTGLEVTPEVDERYHIEKSTRAACRYLKEAYRKYQNWPLVAATYNAGRSAVDRQLARQKVGSYFDLLMSEETERYVYRIIALKMIMEDPLKFGFLVTDDEKYPLWNTRTMEISGPVANLADFAIAQGTNYKMLKYYNPWLRDNTLSNKSGKVYVIQLPAE
ncbi:MAG: lytic transglycosylase domain-containing protein [Bacteroidota bacterium]